jgi:lambda family phage portal protein
MTATQDKPRVRVKAGSVAFPNPGKQPARARYLRDNSSGILTMRQAVTRDGANDVRDSAERASALAWDFIQNSGWIAGAVDQIITDTIGDELKLSARPILKGLGYSAKETTDFSREIEAAWQLFVWRPQEFDRAGVSTLSEQLDGVVRYYLAGGEAFGVIERMPKRMMQGYGLKTGTKVSLIAPHCLKRETNELYGLDQGIFLDANKRPTKYRFVERQNGWVDKDRDFAAWNGPVRQVVHVMDRGDNPDSVRGISVLAPILKVAAQYDQLADATLTTALLQTAFAATIKSPAPSVEAYQAIQDIAEDDEDLANSLTDVWAGRIEALRTGGVSMGDHGKINHLGPDETFEMHTASTPGSNYLPFSQNLQREMARRLGITFESFAMDHSNASYSSVRMAMSSIWPIVTRRRERIVAPYCQAIYEAWLDEMIFTGRIGFKGGYAAFAANRELVTNAEWPGPAQPTADDYKSAMAAKLRIEMGLSSTEDEALLMGRDATVTRQKIAEEIADMTAKKIPIPFGRSVGGGGPMGAAIPNGNEAKGAKALAKAAGMDLEGDLDASLHDDDTIAGVAIA